MPSTSRTPWLRVGTDLAWVFLGGATGGLLRVGLAKAFASPTHALPWVTLAENVTGAFLLGAFLGATRPGRHRRLRLLIGTGALGSFTTYSTFAVEVHSLLVPGRADLAFGYLVITLAGGLVAVHVGLHLGRNYFRRSALQNAGR